MRKVICSSVRDERSFVLLPLAEIAPDVPVPGHAPLISMLAQVDRSGVEKLDAA